MQNFFVTNTYRPVTKMLELINKECRDKEIRVTHNDGRPGRILKITANLIRRKMISTEAHGHDAETTTAVAAHLQHSEETTSRHYIIGTIREDVRQHQVVQSMQKSSLMKEYVLGR